MPRSSRALASCPLLSLLLLSTPARAQLGQGPGIEEAPTRSVYQPGAGVADGAEPFGVVVNPASLGELSGYTLGLRHTETSSSSPWGGRGTGLYAAMQLPRVPVLSWLSRFQVAGALEVLRPPERVPVGTSGKLTFALSFRPTAWLSVGAAYAHLFAPDSLRWDGLNTLDLGARLVFGRYLAAGVVVHDVTGPRGDSPERPLERVYELELLGRPLGDDRLEIGAGTRLGERYADAAPRLRLWGLLLPGLALGAEAALLVGAPSAPGALEWRVVAGLQVDLGHVGASAFGMLGSGAGADVGAGGGSLALRYSSRRYPPVWERRGLLWEIDLAKLDDIDYMDLLADLRDAEDDPRVAGVALKLPLGGKRRWGQAEELRAQLLRLRRAGKHVLAHGVALDSRSYYVATAAERVLLDPGGEVSGLGVRMSTPHWKEVLDRLGVRAEFLHFYEYKSAGEIFSRTEPSTADREQGEAILSDIYERLVQAVASGRHLTEERARQAIDQGVYDAYEARAAGLIDDTAAGDELEEALRRAVGRGVSLVKELPPRARPRTYGTGRPVIAVIRVSGTMETGSGGGLPLLSPSARSGTIAAAVDAAASDARTRAIVLRINSPGGSGLAADEIGRALKKARKRKPVLCSFADLAASAAYNIAVYCDRIFTNPLTDTGSIGLWLAHVDVEELMSRLGMRQTTLTRGKNADFGHQPVQVPVIGGLPQLAYRPFSPEERATMVRLLKREYDRFVDDVAAGRGMRREQVEPLARGRVWTGVRAVERHLCDELGGFMEVIAAARARAGLGARAEVELRYQPGPPPSLGEWVLGLGGRERGADAPGPLDALLEGLGGALQLLSREPLKIMEGPVPE